MSAAKAKAERTAVINRLLLGDQENRKLNKVFEDVLKYVSSGGADDNGQTIERIKQTLASVEFNVAKCETVIQMNTKETAHYETQKTDIDKKLERVAAEIAAAKLELAAARGVKKNRQEYDALARVIAEYPDREQTLKDIKAAEEDLATLAAGAGKLEEQLDTRKKQFRLLVHGIREIQRTFDEEEAVEEAKSAAAKDVQSVEEAVPMDM